MSLFLIAAPVVPSATAEQQQVDMEGGDAASPYALLAATLKSNHPTMHDQDAIDLAAILDKAKSDPETTWLLRKMKEGSGKEHFDEFNKDMTALDIVRSMQEAMNELKALDVLFRDPQRAVQEMIRDGLVPKDKISLYKKDPALLEDDFRKSLYFSLLSYAAAGGYL